MGIERRQWGRWALPAGIAVLTAGAAVAVPALAGGTHHEQAKTPTLAALAKQVTALRAQDATLRRRLAALAKKGSVVGVSGSVGAQGAQGPPGAPGASGAPGAQGLAGTSPVTRFARVNDSGTLIAGSPGTSAVRAGLGRYNVTFDRDVSNCTVVASAGAVDTSITSIEMDASADPGIFDGLPANTVRVTIYNAGQGASVTPNPAGDLRDGPSHLLVFC